jgi:ankyrin repeat protein
MYMEGEVRINDVGRRLMTILEEYGSNQQTGQTISQSSLHLSVTDLEIAAVEVLVLLDQSRIQPSMSMAEAVLLAADAGQTLLHLSASLGFESLLKILLEHGVDPNLSDANGFTALHFATLYGHVQCVRLLVRKGADVNLMDMWGRTAQYVALESHYDDVAEFLEAQEADSVNMEEFVNESGNKQEPGFLKGTEIEPQGLNSLSLSAPKNPADGTKFKSVT